MKGDTILFNDDQTVVCVGKLVYRFIEESKGMPNPCGHCSFMDCGKTLGSKKTYCSKYQRKDKRSGFWRYHNGKSCFDYLRKKKKKPVNKMTSEEKDIVDILL